MYCQYCGSELNSDMKFCTNCGAKVQADNVGGANTSNSASARSASRNDSNGRDMVVVATALDKIRTCYIIWMIISIMQIVIGALTLCVGYGFALVGLGIWNLIQANTMKKNLDVFTYDPGLMYSYYEPRETALIVMLVVNVLFGALFGCIAMIVELTVRSYIIANKKDLS